MTTPDSPDVSIPDVLDGTPYRAERRLGGGAMGEVFVARHVALQKRVVVKVLLPTLADQAHLVDRMRLEAQVIAHLHHVNVVAGHDFGRTREGRAYLVMEYLDGRTLLEEMTARGPLPLPESVAIVTQILSGLAEAHRAGLVHRDIKPSNIFLCAPSPDGRRIVKILDFGVAKLVRAGKGAGPQPLAVPTAEGFVIGSLRYLSPEQARGRPVEPRSDLYAVGGLLYALLTGHDPFRHRTGPELLLAHASENPKPPSLVAPERGIPASVDRVVLRALAKRPEDRFPNADSFAFALGIAAEPLAATAPKRRWAKTELVDLRNVPRPPEEGATLPIVDEPTRVLPRPTESPSPWVARATAERRPGRRFDVLLVLLVIVAMLAIATIALLARGA